MKIKMEVSTKKTNKREKIEAIIGWSLFIAFIYFVFLY